MINLKTDSVIITYKNGFERIIYKSNVRNFNSLLDWIEMFNNGEDVGFLTMTGRDLGSNFSIDPDNVSTIEFI